MGLTVRSAMNAMEEIAPAWMGSAGDPNGLHAGNPENPIRKILLALDATLPVVTYAKQKKCELIITHHPRFYHGLPNLDQRDALGNIGYELARNDIALFCAHTNLDSVPGGINDTLAEIAGLAPSTQCLKQTAFDKDIKLVVFVPESHLASVQEALAGAGTGVIGEYSNCSFRSKGTGSFCGSDKSNPHIGMAGKLEEVEEWRLEVVLPESRRTAVEAALHESHPYEEPAYDLYPLMSGTPYGCGRMSHLTNPVSLKGLAQRIRKATGARGIRALGSEKQKLKQVAVWSGGGVPASHIANLAPDALVCGELGYHDAEILMQAGVGVILLGHGPCEDIILPVLSEKLKTRLPKIRIKIAQGLWPCAWNI